MRAKILTLFILSLFSLVTMSAKANFNYVIPEQVDVSDVPPDVTVIVLNGVLDYNPNYSPIEAYLCHNYVEICFHQNLGCVGITLIGETGSVIYSGSVNTAVQQTAYIPVSGIPHGTYTLILDTVNGYVEGDFVI